MRHPPVPDAVPERAGSQPRSHRGQRRFRRLGHPVVARRTTESAPARRPKAGRPPSGVAFEPVTVDLGICKNARCSRPAVKVAILEGINRETRRRERVEQPVCEEHFRELSRPCDWKGCGLWASNIVPMTGTSAATGRYVEDEFGMCDRHYAEFMSGQTVVIEGITMVHDGHGRFRRLPTDIGRG
jgi:hypothetical protein